MKKLLKRLGERLRAGGTAIAALALVGTMAAATVAGGFGGGFTFEPTAGDRSAVSYGDPNTEHTSYDLSEEEESGKDVNRESDRQKEKEEEPTPPEEDTLTEDDGEILLPEELADEGEIGGKVDVPVTEMPVDPSQPGEYIPVLPVSPDNNDGEEDGDDPSQGGETDIPVTPPKHDDDDDEDDDGGGSGSGDNDDSGKDKITVGGKEYDSIDEALADIADNQDPDKNGEGKYFEGFVKDENGNYVRDENGELIPSYSDNFNTSGSGDTTMDYSGDSTTFVTPPAFTSLEMETVTNRKIDTIHITARIEDVILPPYGINLDNLQKITVSSKNERYLAVDGILYERTEKGLVLVLCPPGKRTAETWPENIVAVGDGAFACSAMSEITLPEGVAAVGDMAFNGAKSAKITLPSTVERVGAYAFMTSTPEEDEETLSRVISLASAKPPLVNSDAFYYMNSEKVGTKIIAKDDKGVYERYLAAWGMNMIGTRLFEGAEVPRVLTTADGMGEKYTYDADNKAFVETESGRQACWQEESGVFRDDLEAGKTLVRWTATDGIVDLNGGFALDDGAFDGCAVKVVRVAAEQERLPEGVFGGWEGLEALISYTEEPFASVTGAPENASVFVKPDCLESYQQQWEGQYRRITATSEKYSATKLGLVLGAIDGKTYQLLQLPYDAVSVSVPSYVVAIGEGAAEGNEVLTAVTGGANVTEIGDRAFKDCTALTSIYISPKMTRIGEEAFMGCASLRAATSNDNGYLLWIPNTVTEVGDRAFKDCASLYNIWCYAQNDVGEEAFAGCTGLTYAYWYGKGGAGEGAFRGCYSLTVMDWRPTETAAIADGCFEGCAALTTWTWGVPPLDNMTYIGDRAFYGCAALPNILPDYKGPTYFAKLTRIGDEAFYGCKAMADAYIGPNVAEIGDNAFGGRDGAPLVVTCSPTVPPLLGEASELEGVTVYVPDSVDHAVYGAYRTAWEALLGDRPEEILKTLGGAENEWAKPEPEPEPEPEEEQ